MRAYDERVLGLTAAQWLCLVLIPVGVLILVTGPRRRARLDAELDEQHPVVFDPVDQVDQ